MKDIWVYSILTIPQDITQMSANIKAPIVINNKTKIARQIVLQDSKLEVKFEMYKELKKYIVNYSSDDSKRTTVELLEKVLKKRLIVKLSLTLMIRQRILSRELKLH